MTRRTRPGPRPRRKKPNILINSDEDDGDEEDALGADLADDKVDDDAVHAVWTPELERCWSLNDILSTIVNGDMSTECFGHRLNRMHRAILTHLGWNAAHDSLKCCALSHFYHTDDKKVPADLPGFPTGMEYRKQGVPASLRKVRPGRKPPAGTPQSPSDDDEDDAPKPASSRKRKL